MNSSARADHRAPEGLQILPVTGLGEFDTTHDLVAEIVTAAGWIENGDVIVITSKVISKTEGRMVDAPTEPDEREALRRKLVDDETVRIVACRDQTLITANRNGLVQAAAGVDGSNVRTDQIALLPLDPDASAKRLRSEFADRFRLSVAVIVTDTMGRAWRTGQTDVAIGAAGIAVKCAYEGVNDSYGNTLWVTDIAIADEIAAAADLVKGKLGGVPVAVVRGMMPVDDGSNARALIRDLDKDLFRLGVQEAFEQGRSDAILSRHQKRSFTHGSVEPELIRSAFAEALRGPAPHPVYGIRFLWIRDTDLRKTLRDAMDAARCRDLTAYDETGEAVAEDEVRLQSLCEATELVIPILVPTYRHKRSGDHRGNDTAGRASAGEIAAANLSMALSMRGIGSYWVTPTTSDADAVVHVLQLPETWQPLGAIAIGLVAEDPGPQDQTSIEGLVIEF